MVATMLILSIVCLVGLGVFFWERNKALLEESQYNSDMAKDYRTTAIVFWVVAGVFLLLILCLCGRIRLATRMIAAAADFITDRKTVLLVPVLMALKISLFILWWIMTFAYVFSMGTIRYD